MQHPTKQRRQLRLLTELSDSEDDDEDNEYDEGDEAALSDEKIVNEVTAEKVESWEWVNEGCPPLN